jgi:hypothetical protein
MAAPGWAKKLGIKPVTIVADAQGEALRFIPQFHVDRPRVGVLDGVR